MKISVITPVHNCPELVRDFAAVVSGCDEVIIIDNASDAQSADVWASVGTSYIRNDTNLHYGTACNQGYQQSTGDIVVFANNDIRGPEGSLKEWASRISAGVLCGASLLTFQAPRQPVSYIDGWLVGATWETWNQLLPIVEQEQLPESTMTRYGVGPFDTSIFTGEYANDLDLSWRAARLGIPLRRVPTTIEHLSNYTAKRTPGAYDYADKNRQAFIKRVMEGESHA